MARLLRESREQSSRNGTMGTAYELRFEMLLGDMEPDGLLTGGDMFSASNRLDIIAGAGSYTCFDDVDGNGLLSASDVLFVCSALADSMPPWARSQSGRTIQVWGMRGKQVWAFAISCLKISESTWSTAWFIVGSTERKWC